MSFEKFAKIEKLDEEETETMGLVKIFIFSAVFSALIIFVGFSLRPALEKEEKRECLRWRGWVESGLQDFKPSPDMKSQCRRWGIVLND
ncbi:MAG: hypothetical protein AAB464_00270 [Patescibacteria group bacterium]